MPKHMWKQMDSDTRGDYKRTIGRSIHGICLGHEVCDQHHTKNTTRTTQVIQAKHNGSLTVPQVFGRSCMLGLLNWSNKFPPRKNRPRMVRHGEFYMLSLWDRSRINWFTHIFNGILGRQCGIFEHLTEMASSPLLISIDILLI